MEAKKNDGNEHEQRKSPLTSIPLFSRTPFSFVFSVYEEGAGLKKGWIILFLRKHSLRSILQIPAAVSILCDFYHLQSKVMATSHTSKRSWNAS